MSSLDILLANIVTGQVFLGNAPNSGTGDGMRLAFSKTNTNSLAFLEYLTGNVGPTFLNLATNSMTANTATFANSVTISSTITSTNLTSGALRVSGGASIVGNLHVGETIYGNIASTTFSTGSLAVTGTATTEDLVVNNDATINGNLIVVGNVTAYSTSEFIVQHPVIEVGGIANATLPNNDGMDRGIEFYWYDLDASAQKEGFFGFANSSQKFVFIPRSTYVGSGDSEVFAGAFGDAQFGRVEANVTSTGTSYFNVVSATGNIVTTGNILGANITGTVITPAQPFITSLGDIGNLTTTGTVRLGTVVTTANVDVRGTMLLNGLVVATTDQAFVGGVVPLATQFTSNVNVNGGAVGGTYSSGALQVLGGVGITGNLFASGSLNAPTIVGTNLTGSLVTATQPNITSVGTLSSLSVTSGITGNLVTAAQSGITSLGTLSYLRVTGNITANANIVFNDGSVLSTVGYGVVYRNVAGSYSGNVITANSFVGNLTGIASNITGQQNSATIHAQSGNFGNTIVMRNTAGDFTANAMIANSTQVYEADLAEKYKTDSNYGAGTVLVFGGIYEVTTTVRRADAAVAGVVSTAPGFVMNLGAVESVTVALRGKVPVKVTGSVAKGDLLITSYIEGHAESVGSDVSYGAAVFAKSLEEDFSTGTKVINAVIL